MLEKFIEAYYKASIQVLSSLYLASITILMIKIRLSNARKELLNAKNH